MAEIKITVTGYKCERCGHQWIPRIKKDIPIICPKCKSPYWNRERKQIGTAQN
jgi:DNA-directed RNA polymerase subunit RPC12/RpoP